MKKNMPLFPSVDNHSLYMDLILAEFRHPILFTCLDEREHMYIVTCFHTDAQETDWLIAETTPAQIIELLCNSRTIRNAFPDDNSFVYLAKALRGTTGISVERHRANKIPTEFFPTPNMLMDGDEDEFKEELSILRKRAADQETAELFDYFQKPLIAEFRWLFCAFPRPERSSFLLKDDSFRTTEQEHRRVSYEHIQISDDYFARLPVQ